MIEHAAKINLGMGCLVLACFFLPWVGLSCGDITFVKLSGYQLTTGKIPLDEDVIRQYQDKLGMERSEEEMSGQPQQSTPKFYFLIVIICAANIIFLSAKMLDEIDRTKSIVTMVFADVGAVFMIIIAAIDFGFDIPSGSEMIIRTSLQPGYYITLAAFFIVAALSVITMKALNTPSVVDMNLNLQIPEQKFSGQGSIKTSGASQSQRVKTCKQCGSQIDMYQAFCDKCGVRQ